MEKCLGDAQHFLLPTDHRSELPILGQPGQVAAEMRKGRPLFRFDLRFGLWLGLTCGLPNRVKNPASVVSEAIRQNAGFECFCQRLSVSADRCQAFVKSWVRVLQKAEQHMNGFCRTTRNFRKVSPRYKRSPQIGMPVQRARRWVPAFSEGHPQSPAELGRIRFSGGQGSPDCIEILSDLRLLVPNLWLRILEKLRVIQIAALAAADPEMVRMN